MAPGGLGPRETARLRGAGLGEALRRIEHAGDDRRDVLRVGGVEEAAASPEISAIAGMFDAATGAADAIASSGGWPKPS